MSAQTHLLFACLQVALWYYRAFALGESALFSNLLLAMFLWYHCLNAVFGGGVLRLERMARAWAKGWVMLVLSCIVVPPLFQCGGYPLAESLNTILFAIPCLVLYWLPVAPSSYEGSSISDQPGSTW